jgi:broad specificity phosphatase PhoE
MVRHGQASFGEVDYDKLSEMGVTQSVLLGEYWLRRGQRFDALFTGAQKRQIDTLLALREVYQKAGRDLPEPVVNEAFNEYDASGMLANFLPILLEEKPDLEETVNRALNTEGDTTIRRKAFQDILTIVMNRWIAGEIDQKSVESWERFTRRVTRGVEEIVAAYPAGKTVAVFTSGGPISAVMQHTLETSDRIALALGWVVKNASINEFKYTGDLFSMTGFNMTPHFEEDIYETYR